jgi:hypothetical protein
VLKHLQSNINYTKIVAIVYTKYVLVAATNSIITVMVCVLTVGDKWVAHLVIRQEVVGSAVLAEVALAEVALVDLVGSEEKVLAVSETLIDLVDLGLDLHHLALMKRKRKKNFSREIWRSVYLKPGEHKEY